MANRKAATKTTTEDLPVRSFTSLLGHLATLTRNHLRVAGNDTSGFDPYPIILLNLFLSMIVSLQGAILLISAKRADWDCPRFD